MPRTDWIEVEKLLVPLCIVSILFEYQITKVTTAFITPELIIVLQSIFTCLSIFLGWCAGRVYILLYGNDATYTARSARTLNLLRTLFFVRY